jgi:hypothetical protein
MLFLRYYLWIAPHILLGLVLISSLRKRLYKQLPFFFFYVAFELVDFLVLFTVSRVVTPSSISVYVWFLTGGAVISGLVQLALLYELAQALIFSRTPLKGISGRVSRWTLAGLLLIAAMASGSLHEVSRQSITNAFQILDFSSNLIRAGMLVVLLLFSRALHIVWRNRLTGVALGFGVSACINLAAAALRSEFGKSAFVAVDITEMAAFHVGVLVWLFYLYVPDRSPAFAGMGLGKSDIQLWDQELQRMTGP